MAEEKVSEQLTLEVPEGVTATIEGHRITVTGEKGEIKRTFMEDFIDYSQDKNTIKITAHTKRLPHKKQKAIMTAIRSHIQNMFRGVTEGYEYKMKILYSHFPMKVDVKGNNLVIDNFLGEKYPRKSVIVPGVDVQVQGSHVILTGINKESVSQTAANIEQSTKIKNLDPRVFQDGIYIVEKDGKPVK